MDTATLLDQIDQSIAEAQATAQAMEAYQAKNDMTTSYHIAQLVRVVKEVKEIITEVE